RVERAPDAVHDMESEIHSPSAHDERVCLVRDAESACTSDERGNVSDVRLAILRDAGNHDLDVAARAVRCHAPKAGVDGLAGSQDVAQDVLRLLRLLFGVSHGVLLRTCFWL